MFHLSDIKKASDGLVIAGELVVTEQVQAREPEVLELSPVAVTGQLRHEGDLYFLDYEMAYTVTLPSSRSLEPVALPQTLTVNEVFIEAANVAQQADLVEEDLVLILEDNQIDLTESVVDNILLNLPIRVLTAQEELEADLPSGNNWSLLTESQYAAQKQADKEANSPFASLQGLFED